LKYISKQLNSLQCFDTVGLVEGEASAL